MYQQGKTGALQTAVNAAATIVAAEISVQLVTISPQGRFDTLKDAIFAELSKQVDADNALFKAEAESSPKATSSKYNKTATEVQHSSGSNNGAITLQKAQDLVLNFGAFKGMTLQEVWEASASEAADRGYGEGDKTGRKYVTWLTGNERNEYVAKHAQGLVDSNKGA